MKNIGFLFLCAFGILYSVTVQAQTKQSVPAKSAEINTSTPCIVKSIAPIYTDDFGQTFNRNMLTNLPYRNVNAIANMVAGVNSYGGAIPNIKGAPASGTAYFVDGVRVYGALPNSR